MFQVSVYTFQPFFFVKPQIQIPFAELASTQYLLILATLLIPLFLVSFKIIGSPVEVTAAFGTQYGTIRYLVRLVFGILS